MPAEVLGRRLRATVYGVQVDVETRRDDGDHLYVVRVSDKAGRPITGIQISLHGRTPEGEAIRAAAEPDGEPGVYRARLARVPEPRDLRLRVIQPNRRFELALGEPVAWE
jgi:hypothetical protein